MKTYGTCTIQQTVRERLSADSPWVALDLFEDAPEIDDVPAIDDRTTTLSFRFAPHVAIRFRRLFDGARANGDGTISISATPSNLEDVDWFLDRYPVDVQTEDGVPITGDPRDWIKAAAESHRSERADLHEVLIGNTEPKPVEMAIPPRDYQLRAADIAYRTGRLLDASSLGLGKAQPLESKVLTPRGWTTIGELTIGDEVVDPDGGVGRVTGVYDRGVRQSYRLSTPDGGKAECCDEHLWTVQSKYDRRAKKTRTVSARELIKAGLRERSGHCQHKFYLPLTVPPNQAGEQAPDIDPYLIGFLIGDGCLKQKAVGVSVADEAALQRIAGSLPTGVTPKHVAGVDYRLTSPPGKPNGLLDAVRKMGLLGKRSWEKHLPDGWFLWSAEHRLELLRGLMDADGTCHANGSATTFTSTSRRLASDVRNLVGSLGGFSSMHSRRTSYTHNDEKRQGRESYRLNIRVPDCPFWLKRKKERWRKPNLARAITRIEPTEMKPMRCIAVSTKRNLYVTDDYIVTHNTITGIALIAKTAGEGGLPALVVVPPHLQLQWRKELNKFAPQLSVHIIKKKKVYPVRADVLICSYFRLDGWRHHLAGRIKTIVFDECAELRRRESEKYRACEEVARQAKWRHGASATPIFNYGGEFWNVMNVIAPDTLGTWSEFLSQWCVATYEERKARLQDPAAFGAYLNEQLLMVRWTRADVARELPPLTRAVETVDIDESVLDAYESRALELAKAVLEKQGKPIEQLKAAQDLSRETRLATGLAKAPFVAEWVDVLCETTQEPVVLFAWHRAVWDILAERLEHRGVAWHTGSESTVKKQRELERFKSGHAKVLFMSLRSGIGVDGLQSVSKQVVFGELDWSPAIHEQAMGRLHRDGQSDAVMAYYLLARDSMDQVIADVLGLKQAQLTGVRDVAHQDQPVQEIPKEHVKSLAKAVLARFGRGKVEA